MNKQPEKTAQTKRCMINAFWELAETHGMEHVTISAIMKRAGLNRGTFYVYFTDLPDLIEQAEREIIEDLQGKAKEVIQSGGIQDIQTVVEHIMELFLRYDSKLFLLLRKNGDPNFRTFVINEFIKMFSELPLFESTKNSEYIPVFIASAFMGVITYWHETGKKVNHMEVVKIVHSLVTKGISSIL